MDMVTYVPMSDPTMASAGNTVPMPGDNQAMPPNNQFAAVDIHQMYDMTTGGHYGK